jgi:ribonuclease BN (tRNA processing enzyme)
MRIEVLGCSGGIGDGRQTTSFLIDDDILLDAGSGVLSLSRAQMALIDHVFITHSHLDHILSLPLLLDSVANERVKPLQLHAIPEVLEILKDHIFNWRIWPDFSRIPSSKAPFLVFSPVPLGQVCSLPDSAGTTRAITPIPAHHTVPTSGFHLHGVNGSLLFSADTNSHPALWRLVAQIPDLLHLVVECSYVGAQRDIAEASRHFHTHELASDLAPLELAAKVWITHLKPGAEAEIMAELRGNLPADTRLAIERLNAGQVFNI